VYLLVHELLLQRVDHPTQLLYQLAIFLLLEVELLALLEAEHLRGGGGDAGLLAELLAVLGRYRVYRQEAPLLSVHGVRRCSELLPTLQGAGGGRDAAVGGDSCAACSTVAAEHVVEGGALLRATRCRREALLVIPGGA
jgi:hypothetical protein